MTQAPPANKTCKICGDEKAVDQFANNPNAKDGKNSICRGCFGKSPDTQRGRDRTARDLRYKIDVEAQVEKAFVVYRLGDLKKDLLIRQLLIIIYTPGTNQQSQLTAITKLMEIHGLGKETPKSEEDFVHAAFERLKNTAEKK